MPPATLRFVPDITDLANDWRELPALGVMPSPPVRRWLEDEGSLTKQLVALSARQFRVERQEESWITLQSAALARHFGPVASQHRFWSRKVLLMGREQPWVAAHTLVPEHSFCSPLQEVMTLQNKPLGEFLFSHPDLLRSRMDFVLIGDQCWGRRSLFLLYQKPVMVAEFFLPALVSVLDNSAPASKS